MTVSRVTRVSNPRSSRRRARANPKRRLSLKQKLHFGNPRQRAAARAALKRKRRAKANPVRRRRVRAVRRVVRRRRKVIVSNPVRRRRRRRVNPAHMVTLGLVNPAPRRGHSKRRKKSNMARTRTRRRRARATNPRRRRRNTRVIVRNTRRRRRHYAANPRRRRRYARAANSRRRRHHRRNARRMNSRRRRNPSIFGHSVGAFEMAKIVAAGLAGVAITKAVPNMLPAGMLPSSPITSGVVAVVGAIGSGMAVSALIKSDPMLGYAVGFGGLMQAGSLMLNAFVPSVGQYLSLQGLGDLVPARFPVPQNPISAGVVPALPAPMPAGHGAASGVGALYNPYGRAM